VINTSSAASLSLEMTIQKCLPLLGWIWLLVILKKLNDQDIIAQRTFAVTQGSSGLPLALLQI
jgi:hypothetical protein